MWAASPIYSKPCGENKGRELIHWKMENGALMKLSMLCKHLIWFQLQRRWCETAEVRSGWGMRRACMLGFVILGKKKNCTDRGTRWDVSNLRLRGCSLKLCISNGRAPQGWLGRQFVEVQWHEKRLCLYNIISREINGIKWGMDLNLKAQ